MSLKLVQKILKNLDVESEWQNAESFKTFTLLMNNNEFSYETSGRDTNGGRLKRGVYRHIATIDGDDVVLYIGKSQGVTSSVAMRQDAHFRAFWNKAVTSERSGVKYRNLMEEYAFDELDVRVDYIDLTDYNQALIPMFEELSIQHFKPMLNQ